MRKAKIKKPTNNLETKVFKYNKIILIILIVLGILLAFIYRFVQDDAFISFLYSKNLIEGKGLTWFGTTVEGYTNFLWVIWISLGMYIGVEPVLWTFISGITCFALIIYFLWKISFLLFNEYLPVVLTVILFLSNYTILCYATGGLETILQTCLITIAVYYMLLTIIKREISIKLFLIISIISSLAILTRLDSILPILVIYFFIIKNLQDIRKKNKFYIALIAPIFLIVGSWFVWKLNYYGTILPNSFSAKIGEGVSLNDNGINYLVKFFWWYYILPFLLFGLVIALLKRTSFNKNLIPLLFILLSWFIYIIYVGGDFMEFRFIVPISPFIFVILSYSIFYLIGRNFFKKEVIVSIISILILVIGSYNHQENFKYTTIELDSINYLSTFYGLYPKNEFNIVGDSLKANFGNKNISFAIGAVGAIPYYSGLKTIDMLGLNELNVDENFWIRTKKNYKRPGHGRIIKLDYLINSGVNFIIGHPIPVPRGYITNSNNSKEVRDWFLNLFEMEPSIKLKELNVVGMPIDNSRVLMMVYLNGNEEIEKIIENKKWDKQIIKIKS